MKYVLFVCTHNAGRSQMAQAFFERDCSHDCRAESAGSQPARQVWPEVIDVMREIGIDLAGHKPKRLTVEMQLHADWAVTMGCGDVCPYVPTRVDNWDIPDDHVPIRSHIFSLAHKRTRECLKQETCEVLEYADG